MLILNLSISEENMIKMKLENTSLNNKAIETLLLLSITDDTKSYYYNICDQICQKVHCSHTMGRHRFHQQWITIHQ